MPLELIRWTLVERYGWTLPEVDALTMADLVEWFQVEDGRSKAAADGAQPDNRLLGGMGRRKRR